MASLLRLKPFPLVRRPSFAQKVPSRVRLRLEAFNRARRRAYLRKVFTGRDFSIVSCNCWGAGIYHDLDRPFNSPFIGLYLNAPCFLKYVAHYETARLAPLSFIDQSRYPRPREYGHFREYPIGVLLDDIEIHFVHFTQYKSREEAREKWQRRSLRLPENPDDAYFMLGNGSETLAEKQAFVQSPLRSKVLFSAHPTPGFDQEIVVPPWRGDLMMDGPMLYEHCHAYWDIERWLKREGD